MKYTQHFSTRETPQSESIPGKDMVANSAGGFAFAITDWERLDRFLVLGSEGGSYYATERKLTVDNAEAGLRCIESDGQRVVQRIVEISKAGRAPKNDPALFVLAMCAGMGDTATRKAALAALPQVARIGTHLFHFAEYVQHFRGWGRSLREAIARWYNDMPTEKLAYQIVKYQQRDGWSHRDLLRLSHPQPASPDHDTIYGWITQGSSNDINSDATRLLYAYEQARQAESTKDILPLIEEYRLTREMIPTQFLGESKVWEAMLSNGIPMTALIRNLGNLTRLGVLKPMGKWTQRVVEQILNEEHLRAARIHPLAVLVALKVYESGGGVRSQNTWEPVREIVDALDKAFYLSFGNVKSTGKRLVLGLDVSGSMAGPEIAGMPGITPRVGSAAMALVTAAVEQQYAIMAFSQGFTPIQISPRERLDDALRKVDDWPYQGTDCALPILWAMEKGIEVDAFVIYTDSETWCGMVHPVQALQQYRRQSGIPAKLVVVGMVSNEFSIADPDDGGMLDVVGFDVAAPNVIGDFVRG